MAEAEEKQPDPTLTNDGGGGDAAPVSPDPAPKADAPSSVADVTPTVKDPTEAEPEKEDISTSEEEDSKEVKHIEVEKPDDVPSDWWDSDKGTLSKDKVIAEMEKKDKIAKDLRNIIAKGTKAPEKADDYKFEPTDAVKALEIHTDDELMGVVREIAFNQGFSNDQFNNFLNEYFGAMIDGNFIDTPLSEAEAKTKQTEFFNAEKDKLGDNADKIIQSSVDFIQRKVISGVFTERERDLMIGFMDKGAESIRIIDKLRQASGEQSIPTTNSKVEGLKSDEDIAGEWHSYSDKEKHEIMEKRSKAGRSITLPAQFFRKG